MHVCVQGGKETAEVRVQLDSLRQQYTQWADSEAMTNLAAMRNAAQAAASDTDRADSEEQVAALKLQVRFLRHRSLHFCLHGQRLWPYTFIFVLWCTSPGQQSGSCH